jgi:hypothetical protein
MPRLAVGGVVIRLISGTFSVMALEPLKATALARTPTLKPVAAPAVTMARAPSEIKTPAAAQKALRPSLQLRQPSSVIGLLHVVVSLLRLSSSVGIACGSLFHSWQNTSDIIHELTDDLKERNFSIIKGPTPILRIFLIVSKEEEAISYWKKAAMNNSESELINKKIADKKLYE